MHIKGGPKMRKRSLILLALALCLTLLTAASAWADTSYNIQIGDTEITSSNASDVFGDGTVSYDPSTKTLTLDNFTYEGQGYYYSNAYYGILFRSSQDVVIELIGENSIMLAPADENCSSSGLSYQTYGSGNVAFKGSGSLVIRGGDLSGTSTRDSYGMYINCRSLTFGNDFTGSVTAIGGDLSYGGTTCGLFAYRGFDVFNGSLTGIGGNKTGERGGLSCGILYSSDSSIYGGSVTGVGGNVTTEIEDSDYGAYSYGLYSYYSSYDLNVFDGTLLAVGGDTLANGGDATSYGMYWGDLRAYGGVSVFRGGDASQISGRFSDVQSYGVSYVSGYGGAVLASAGTVNRGFRTALYDYYFYHCRHALSSLYLGEDSIIAKAVSWADGTGASGFGELTVTSDHSSGSNAVTGTVGGVSNWKESLGYKYNTPPWATGILIVPSDWEELDDIAVLDGDSYCIDIEMDALAAADIDLNGYTFLCASLYEGLEDGEWGCGLNLFGDISGDGGNLVAVGPTISGDDSASYGIFQAGTVDVSGSVNVTAVGGASPSSYGVSGSGEFDLSGLDETGRFQAFGYTDAANETGLTAGGNYEFDGGSYYKAVSLESEIPEYTVEIIPGAHMSLASGSGDLVQEGLSGAMETVILNADEGYYFPEDFIEKNFLIRDDWSIKAERTRNYFATKITISGIPAKDLTIELDDAELYVYPVWLGGVRIDAENKGDLVAAINEAAGKTVATGEASYEITNFRFHSSYSDIVTSYVGTLTLKDFSYTGEGYEYEEGKAAALYYDRYKITYPLNDADALGLIINVSGDNSVTISPSEDFSGTAYGSYLGASVTITGSGTFTSAAEAQAPLAIGSGAYKNWAGELTIDGASVFFKGPLENADESNGLMSESRTNVQNGGRITFSGADLAIKNSYSSTDRTRLVYSGNYALIVGDEPEGGNLELYAGTGNDLVADIQSGGYKYLTLGEAELFIGGVAITSANRDDIVAAVNALYPDSITGSAVYDPDAHKLTLSGVSLVNKSTGSADKDYAGILYAGTEPLEIVLEGENSVTGRDRSGDDSRGLYSQKAALSFTGSGSLTATGGNITSGYGDSYGICAYYGMTFDGPTIKAYGGSCPQDYSYGIFGGVALTDGKIEAYGGTASNDDSYGIDGDVTVDGGELTATGGSSYYYSYGIDGNVTMNGGKLSATGGSSRSDESYGIDGTLTLNDGEVFACGGSSQRAYSVGVYRAEVKGGKLTARAADSYYTSCGVYSSLTVSGGEVNISGASETNSASYGVDSSVTISGGKTVISSGNGAYTRGIYGSLTVTGGEITVTAEEPSDQESGYSYGVNGTVSISGGKAKISSSEAPTSYAIYGYPDIRGGSLELIADGSRTAQVCTSSIYVSENGEIRKVSPNADGSEPVEFDRYSYASYKYLLSGSAYKLWVGDVRVNDENASDVLGDGTVSFDEATSTLTLNGANIAPETRNKGIELADSTLGPLTILVKGENSITVGTPEEYSDPAGIYCGYDASCGLNIEFEEGASLTIDGACTEDRQQTGYGIYSYRDLNISGPGTLQIDGIDLPESCTYGTYGIYVYNGDMTLSDGVTADVSGGRTGMRSNYYGNMNYGQSNGVCSAYGRAVIVNSGCELKARAGEVQCENTYSYMGYAVGINAGSVTVDGSLTAEGYRAVNCTVTAGENTIVYAGVDSFEAEKLNTLSYSGSDPYVRVMEKKPFLLGDVNCDGEVTAADLTKLARHVAKIETLEDSAALQAADVTKDDAISAADLTKLARYVAQIIKTFD